MVISLKLEKKRKNSLFSRVCIVVQSSSNNRTVLNNIASKASKHKLDNSVNNTKKLNLRVKKKIKSKSLHNQYIVCLIALGSRLKMKWCIIVVSLI